MKKIFSLLLIAGILFSLVACSDEANSITTTNDHQIETQIASTEVTETATAEALKEIEITLDNWNEYLELKYMPSWKYNAFDEIEGFSHLYPVLALKEEYMDHKVSSNTDLAVGFSAMQIWKCVSADMETKTYEWGEVNGEKKEVNETAKYYPQTQFGDPHVLNEGGLIFLSYYGHHENGKDSYPYFEDFNIERIEGTLIFE